MLCVVRYKQPTEEIVLPVLSGFILPVRENLEIPFYRVSATTTTAVISLRLVPFSCLFACLRACLPFWMFCKVERREEKVKSDFPHPFQKKQRKQDS